MSEKVNGNGTWMRWVLGIAVTALLAIGGIMVNAQARRDDGQDKRIEALETDCKDIPSLRVHIEYIRKSVDEINKKMK